MPPPRDADNACSAPASPTTPAPTGSASLDVPPAELALGRVPQRTIQTIVATSWKRPLPVSQGVRPEVVISEEPANRLLSHYPVCGLRGPDVALRISLKVF
jgi:hypothetical protein